jgi:23S rRNA (guanine745-N1)-methyltransferase
MASDPPFPALDAVADRLRCPICADSLRRDDRRLLCPAGHAFDIARHGYANLITGHRRHRGDDARMVAARERFLGAGHYRPLSGALAELAAAHTPIGEGIVVDLAGGTGHHLPVRTGAAAVVLSVFGPRGVAEIERVLEPGGIVVVTRPLPGHLAELGRLVGGIGIDPRKPERLAASFRRFERLALEQVTERIVLGHAEIHAVMAMGPSARHLTDEQLDRAIVRLPARADVTLAVEISVHRSRRGRPADRASRHPGG